ncbi:hypothetical protein JRO89_XS06G0065500 [Xanthoceras sorbifolium]|uniref:Uncharacterized protein n=1 Tax=Xanthoceras sorbifolium TaxID=99658 RepID=A0ABQ8HWY3_9ROSI|nr:hypothetical protein JRO89_XS06G0065500 [Xanthoceras sorbifolium]
MISAGVQVSGNALFGGSRDHETSNGWPLGLEIMNTRLQVMEGAQAALAVEPSPTHRRTISFSSFSSSNLDTEINQSTASFFQDNSVSLGRLIGFKPSNGGSLYFPKAIHFEEHERIAVRGKCSDVNKGHIVDLSHGICIPLLMKMSRSRSKPRV